MTALGTETLVERAQRVIPGGVNSVNRVLPWPMAVVEAAGAYFTDADGQALPRLPRRVRPAGPGPQPPAGERRGARGDWSGSTSSGPG